MGSKTAPDEVLLVRFCSKCGSIMAPIRKDKEVVMRCSSCGYEIPVTEKDRVEMRTVSKGEPKILTTKTVSKTQATGEERREELEQAKDSYYEIVLESIGEYGE
ncbi:MAG: transcription elongation factor [Acidilobaceae archaeon]